MAGVHAGSNTYTMQLLGSLQRSTHACRALVQARFDSNMKFDTASRLASKLFFSFSAAVRCASGSASVLSNLSISAAA